MGRKARRVFGILSSLLLLSLSLGDAPGGDQFESKVLNCEYAVCFITVYTVGTNTELSKFFFRVWIKFRLRANAGVQADYSLLNKNKQAYHRMRTADPSRLQLNRLDIAYLDGDDYVDGRYDQARLVPLFGYC